jgi:hypothetical protein
MAQGIGGGKKIDLPKQVLSGLIHVPPADSQVAVRTTRRNSRAFARASDTKPLLYPFLLPLKEDFQDSDTPLSCGCHRSMRPEEGAHVTHRQRNPVLGLFHG